ncbi:MAG TPA: PAS domain-containing protein [Gemmatimonadales bacterium]|nr:PAS domain-containing protein [Gemmatimonadales bacterium]
MTAPALPSLGLARDLGLGQFARLVEQLPVVLWSTDVDLRLTAIRGGGAQASQQGKTIEEAFGNPSQAAPVVAAHRAALRGESVAYETVFHGRAFSARVEPVVGPHGRVVGVVGFAFDVTERHDSQERLRAIIDSEPDCVKLVDSQGRLLEMNPAGLAMIEAPSIDAIRLRPMIELVAPEHRAAFADLHARVFAGQSATLEFEIIGLTGRRRWLETHAVPFRDPAGAVQALLGITRDVTETRRAEEQLRASRAALRSLATRQQDIRENERTRIAREIHDSLGQALTALKMQLAAAQDAASRESPALSGRLHETALTVDDLVKSVRRIASDLRPPILDQLGLPAALEWLAQDFTRRTSINCRSAIGPTNGAITGEMATALFRIVQEALTNVVRHARATRVDIHLGMKSGCVTLEINDDGGGITEASTIGPGSLGILGMRERAAVLGGVLEVAPREEGGTRVAAWFPPAPGGAGSGR